MYCLHSMPMRSKHQHEVQNLCHAYIYATCAMRLLGGLALYTEDKDTYQYIGNVRRASADDTNGQNRCLQRV